MMGTAKEETTQAMRAAVSLADRRVQRRTFEGLFLELELTAEMRATLGALGVDPDDLAEEYPLTAWQQTLVAIHAELARTRGEDQAWRELGRRYLLGFVKTTVGSAVAGSSDELPIERMLARFPRMLALAREDMVCEVQCLAERDWKMTFASPNPQPMFMVGVVESLFFARHVAARVEVADLGQDVFTLRMRW
jgi:uncharacterized protein (TIGR02265 family)